MKGHSASICEYLEWETREREREREREEWSDSYINSLLKWFQSTKTDGDWIQCTACI